VLSLKEEFLKLLREDMEFRYAVIGLLGLEEVLRRIDKNTEAIMRLQEQVAEHSKAILALQRSVESLSKSIEKMASSIQSIGMRYGIFTEDAFRESIKYLIEDLLKEYKVERWIYYDEKGIVYGHPSIVEVDVLIKDKEQILVEYKASTDRADVSELYRIGQLYEKVKGVKPRLLIVSPGIRKRAKELAEKMGIELRGTVFEI